jgi:hypothetical protein
MDGEVFNVCFSILIIISILSTPYIGGWSKAAAGGFPPHSSRANQQTIFPNIG